MHVKHKAQTEKLIEAEKAFRKVAAEFPLVSSAIAKKKKTAYDLQGELLALNA